MKVPPRRYLPAALMLALAVLALAGCGDDSSGSGSSKAPSGSASSRSTTPEGSSTSQAVTSSAPAKGKALTKPQLLSHADGICRRLNGELAATVVHGTSAQAIARDVPRNIALEHKALAELDKLVAPGSIARRWQQVLAERATLADELTQLLHAAKRNDAAARTTLIASKKQSHAALLKAATGLGFNDCATVG
jgi:hypothetical protein